MSFPEMLEKSIIVSAHPDDEVLWFSSILDKVNQVVICFISNESNPRWEVGRRKSLLEYPIENIVCLNMDESNLLNGAAWKSPVTTEYGLEIVNRLVPSQRIEKYKNNYETLRRLLAKQVEGYRNVFTHSPWGEYGHEEHVQVYRAVKSLQKTMQFNLWCSNYVADKSFQFMLTYRHRLSSKYIACETNRTLANNIKDIYKKNKCWTWHADWEWFKKESFLSDAQAEEGGKRSRPFPVNYIKVGHSASWYSTIHRATRSFLSRSGVEITRRRLEKRERVVSLKPKNDPLGTVLLSWYIAPFLLKEGDPTFTTHPKYWDCTQVARTFLDLGYAVDAIDSDNQTFMPTKPYAMFVGHRSNFDRLAESLPRGCFKIAYLDTAHWVFNNHATLQRQSELQLRKGVVIRDSHRLVGHDLTIEHADCAILYGNQFTLDTYRYAHTTLFQISRSTATLLPWSEHKTFDACRRNFLWLGGHGFVHKGLDVVLEAFAGMPEHHLYVCGPLEKEKEFVKVFYKELYQTPNIHPLGWVDVNSQEFVELAGKCVGIVFPSCSEGQASSVITAMHAGLIPIVSHQSGINVDDFGIVLTDHHISTIQETVRRVSNLSTDHLYQMAKQAWECARTTYTREHFAMECKNIVLRIMKTIETLNSEKAH